MPQACKPSETDDRRRFNPDGVVYGVLALATVIAAESTRRESFPKLVEASAITIGLYWMAHAYARHWGSRVEEVGHWSLAEILLSLKQESSILVGAAVPTAVLALAWIAGLSLETAVTAVLWSAGVELIALEIGVAIRRHSGPRDLAVQSLLGLGMGLGIFVLRLVLH